MFERFQTAFVLVLRYLYLTRFSWLLGLLLVAIAPLCRDVFPSLLANLLVLDHPQQVYHVSWISLWCAVTVMETLRVTTLNAHDRFEDYTQSVEDFRLAWDRPECSEPEPRQWYRELSGWTTFLAGLAAALSAWYSLIYTCIVSTANDPGPAWELLTGSAAGRTVESICWRQAFWGLLTTLLILSVLHLVAIAIHELTVWRRTKSEPLVEGWGNRFRQHLHTLLGPGYFRETAVAHDSEGTLGLRLAPGHVRMTLYTTTFAGWYLFNYMSAIGEQPMPTEDSPYPAMFYGLLSLLLSVYLLPGIAFFLDRYRVPVLLLFAAISLMLYGFFGTDHYYELNPPSATVRGTAAPPLQTVLEGWDFPRDRSGRRTLVVVDAAGGGIQAAAWTAQVLTGLHECYADPFSRSIGLISAVSGGSVGSMYYLVNRAELASDFDRTDPAASVLSAAAIDQIRWATRASALEATAWGIAYPDTIRVLFPPAVSPTIDRGWALERVWRQRMRTAEAEDLDDWRLTDLVGPIRDRQLPVVVFNATLMETGQRYLLSPILSPPSLNPQETAGAVELRRELPSVHTRISTAARLSATFPYVTPAVRAEPGQVSTAKDQAFVTHHVVDGGYADNEGIVTSVDWLNRLLEYYSQDAHILDRPFDRILLIRIQAFPSGTGGTEAEPMSGWKTALAGPLDAMLKVRRASQTERGDLEIGLLTQATRSAMRASRERYEGEMKAMQAVLDALADASLSGNDDRRGSANLSAADAARQQLEQHDRRRTLAMLRDQLAAKRDRLQDVDVEALNFDFYLADTALVPLSWKLTQKQQARLEAAWQTVLDGQHPNRPLELLDRYFVRVDHRGAPHP